MSLTNIHPKAHIGANVTIEPFTTIAEHVEIGEGTWIGPNVTIMDYVKIGKNCKVFPGAVIGGLPQDLKFAGEVSYVEIGDNTTLREFVTVSRGTAASGKHLTKVGNNCFIMSYVHVAHDCRIEDNVILASYVGLAGEVEVHDYAIVGGASGAHQFCKIGAHAMISGGSYFGKDVPPYALAGRRPLVYGGINVIGLRRRNFTNEQITAIKDIYNVIYHSGLNTTDACNKVETDFPATTERDVILNFIRSSKRGIIRSANGLSLDEE
jgi:UDP-N-acetylglucosamine acyltransferase